MRRWSIRPGAARQECVARFAEGSKTRPGPEIVHLGEKPELEGTWRGRRRTRESHGSGFERRQAFDCSPLAVSSPGFPGSWAGSPSLRKVSKSVLESTAGRTRRFPRFARQGGVFGRQPRAGHRLGQCLFPRDGRTCRMIRLVLASAEPSVRLSGSAPCPARWNCRPLVARARIRRY